MSFIINPYRFAATPTDPNFSSVVLLCHFEGSDASTTFTDQKGHALTAQGDAQIDTAQFKFGSASGLFDGTGDRVTAVDSADWDFGSGDFTVEAFVRFNSTTGDQAIVSQWETPTQRAWLLRKASGGNLDFIYSKDGGTTTVTSTGSWAPSTATWYYVAAKRSGTTLTVWVNGSQVGTVSAGTDTIHNSTGSLRIGSLFVSPSESQLLNGWVDELRITKGVARDVSSVPTAAFPDS